MRGTITAALAIALAAPIAACSVSGFWSDPHASANAAADDAKCQGDGWEKDSPDYLQCLKNRNVERTIADAQAQRLAYPGIFP